MPGFSYLIHCGKRSAQAEGKRSAQAEGKRRGRRWITWGNGQAICPRSSAQWATHLSTAERECVKVLSR
jgi:hypothetical protein